MKDELDGGSPIASPLASSAPRSDARWSVILPFFNESDYLERTLASLANQTRRVRVILVDNGSTDDSAALTRTVCRRIDLDHCLVTEYRPGKVAALARGLRYVDTEFVATCDADTWYPPDYLAKAEAIMSVSDVVATGAYFVEREAPAIVHRREAWHITAAGMILANQCHAGGAGHAFRTSSLLAVGGFDPVIWNWILEDHEVMNRVAKVGHIRYAATFWCSPSIRERQRPSVRWTVFERILYHSSSAKRRDWFFYKFLARRLSARGLASQALREAHYQQLETGFGVPDPLRR